MDYYVLLGKQIGSSKEKNDRILHTKENMLLDLENVEIATFKNNLETPKTQFSQRLEKLQSPQQLHSNTDRQTLTDRHTYRHL